MPVEGFEMHEITRTPHVTQTKTYAPPGDSVHITQTQRPPTATVRPPKTISTIELLKELHTQAAASKLALEQNPFWKFWTKNTLAEQAKVDQKALWEGATQTKDASHLAYSIICNGMTDLESKWQKLKVKEESELTPPQDPLNPQPDQHAILIQQTTHLKHLQTRVESSEKASFTDNIEAKWLRAHWRWIKKKASNLLDLKPAKEKISEKATLLAQYSNLLNFKNIFEKRLVAAAKKQLDSDVKTVKTILDKPNSFSLALAKNLKDLNTKMRIAQAKLDKKYFYSGYTTQEAAEQKALEAEYQEVLKLIIPPKKVDLRSFDQMRQKAQSGGTNSNSNQ